MLVVALLVLAPLIIFLIKTTLSGSKTKLPPGPNTWQILRRASELRKRPHAAFTSLSKIHGPLMSLRVGSRVVIIVSSAKTAREVLQTQDRNFSGRFMPLACYEIPGVNEASIAEAKECNNTWKHFRGITQNSIFSSRSIDSRASTRNAKALEMVTYLQSKQGRVVQLDDLMESTVYNILSDILVSRNIFDIAREDGNDENMRAAVRQVTELAASSMGLSDLFPSLRKIDFSIKRKAMAVFTTLSYIWGDFVRERRLGRSARSRGASDGGDFLDVLLDNELPDDQIYVFLMELLISASDTSGRASIWLMAELIKNPHIRRRVADEVAEAFQDDMMVINESILTECHYLQACIKETLRIHNPGPLSMPHRAIEACKIDNYVIPKDSIVMVNFGAIGREPEKWKDADVFNPDRFLDSDIDFRGSHFEYIPFSAGRRMCPGFNVAFKNIQIVVASLVHFFDWSFPDGRDLSTIDMTDKFDGLLKMETPMHLIPMCKS